jgi:Na+-translocating ferredoxin:NAD+ oxidoreductase RnfG subunit
MAKNKKMLISVVAGLAVLAIVVGGMILTLNAINNNNATKNVVPTTASAQSLRDQAETARENADTSKSKELLLEAKKQYESLPITDANTNAKIDIEAQLWLLEHPNVPAATPVTP